MDIRRISDDERAEALALVMRVFMQYEAPDYSPEGVESFQRTAIYNEEFIQSIIMHGAYEQEEIVGMIATRNDGNHIALFFVDGQNHRKGIGKKLFQTVLEQSTATEITVNSSPYAKEIYRHLGFEPTAEEQVTDGIRYIPMRYKKEETKVDKLMAMLEEKDNSETYKALQELERISDETGSLYEYTEKFLDMIGNEKYIIRVRGFRLFCKQAKWDTQNLMDENVDKALQILDDDKPTAVRQALASLLDVVKHKPSLREVVKRAVSDINYLRYKDTMHSLIAKDIQKVLQLIE